MNRKAIFLAVASLFAEAAFAQALPTGGTVTRGDGSIGTTGSAMTVTQSSQRAIFDFTTYNIGAGASVTYAQPNASAVAVNRVPLSAGRSQIDGTLSANGHVMLLNPNGVLFGSTAVVNVGSLTASTGAINDTAFMESDTAAIAITGATAGSIENRGSITVAHAGLVAFVAPSVANSGVITAVGGRIVLAGAQAATVSLNGGLYEITVGQGVAGSSVDNTGTLTTAAAASGSVPAGTIVLSAPEVEGVVSGAINLSGIQRANRIEVLGGVVVLGSDLDATTLAGSSSTVNVLSGGQIQDAVDIAKVGAPGAGATVNVSGTHAEQVTLNKANLTLHGETGAKITVPDLAQVDGVTITANNVTVSGLEIAGPVTSSYLTYPWGSNISRGIAVRNGVTGFAITGNNIHDVRNGILIDGRNTGSVTGNRIENTKSGISVQYTDAAGITISGNSQGPIGNEWGLNLHLNGFLDGGTIYSNPHLTAPSASWQQALLALSAANGGWAVQDQGYSSSNRTHVTVKTSGSASNQGSPLAPLNTIQAGVNAAVSGGKVNVGAGTFAENLSISKPLTLTGAGAAGTIIDPVSGDAVSISGNMGASATLTIDGFAFRDAPRYGVTVAGDTVLRELEIRNSDFVGNGRNGFALLGSPTTGVPGLAKVSLVDDVFVGNGTAVPASLGYGDILVNYYNGDMTFRNLHITGNGEFIGIQIRGASATLPSGTMMFDNVTIDGSFLRPNVPNGNAYGNVGTWNPGGPGDAIHLLEYGSVANVSFNNVVISPTVGHGMFLEGLGSTLDIGNTRFGVPDTVVTGIGTNPTISRNVFVGSNSNNLVTIVDADRSTFVGAADGFAIENRVLHGVDFAGLGLVTWQPGHVYVTADSGSIQRGIDAAGAGETVHVGAGTFANQLTVTKSLTLEGAGASQTIVSPTSLVADASGMKNILTIGGSATTDVELSGFTFRGPVPEINAGIFVRDGAHAHIHDNRLVDMRESAALSGVQRGVGIFVGRALIGTSGTALIENNVITGYQKGGIVIDGPGSQATVTGNIVTGEGPTDVTAQNGIQISRGASAAVSGNTVSGNNYTPASDEAVGILIFTPGTNLSQGSIAIGPNNVSGNEVGVWTNDPRTLGTISLSGVTGNLRDGVADFGGGYAGQGPLLEYPAWAQSNAALVNAAAFGGKQSGDIVDVGGTLKVTGWNVFGAIQPAVDTVTSGATIDVATGTYPEIVTVGGLRNFTFNDVTLTDLTFSPGAADSGLRGRVTATGSTGFFFEPRVILLGDTSLATTGANITFKDDIQGSGGAAYALSLNAGIGDVKMYSGGSSGNPLGRFEVQANNFMLQSTLWVSGYDINALGTVALSDHTLRSVGGSGTDAISAGGDVTGSTVSESPVQIQSTGDVAANVTSQGAVAVEATNVSGSYTAPSITVAAQETVNVAVNAPGPVEIHSEGPANVSGSAPALVVDAPSGSVSGDFGQVSNVGSGLIEVNGKPQVNTTLAESANNNRVVPQEITTAASPEAGSPQRGGGTVVRRRRKPEDALDMLENGESIEIDLTPG